MKAVLKGITLLTCVLLSSCVSIDKTKASRLSEYSEAEIKNKLVLNITTRKDALMAFGPPENAINYNEEKKWIYTSEIINHGLYIIVPVFKDRKQHLSLEFSDNGLLSNYNYQEY
ncbi:hypothetical protein [Raoultella terrigena]|uniref:hypothetical protein n=1 Tax=Raoultella terrigena TaxID=577 RepID=UPI0013301F1C|nr:hypothetical protein [Raoultella terrigena]